MKDGRRWAEPSPEEPEPACTATCSVYAEFGAHRGPCRTHGTPVQSILDAYAYRTLVWEIYVERVVKPRDGSAPDEVRISSAIGQARRIVTALEELTQSGPFLLGNQLTLADCHAASMMHLFQQAEEGALLLKNAPGLSRWLEMFRSRASFVKTAPTAGD